MTDLLFKGDLARSYRVKYPDHIRAVVQAGYDLVFKMIDALTDFQRQYIARNSVVRGDYETVSLLIRNADGSRELYAVQFGILIGACQIGNYDLIIAHIRNQYINTDALDILILGGHTTLLERLITEKYVKIPLDAMSVCAAGSSGSMEMIDLIATYNTRADQDDYWRNDFWRNVLIGACKNGHINVVREIMDRREHSLEFTTLAYLVRTCDIAEYVLEHGVSLPHTVFVRACDAGNVELAMLYLRDNPPTDDGLEAVIESVCYREEIAVAILDRSPADLDRAFQLACHQHRPRITRLILELGRKRGIPLNLNGGLRTLFSEFIPNLILDEIHLLVDHGATNLHECLSTLPRKNRKKFLRKFTAEK